MDALKTITLRGVRVHNLKNIDVEIPVHRLTVVTGVSGAGKSSLVFDTLYAEAQRRYLQSFSTYTRQFLERFDKPDADEISDLPPAIAIRGGTGLHSPRATVGSLTDLGATLRQMFALAGTIVCPACGQAVTAHRPRDVLAALQAMPGGTRCTIAFPTTTPNETDQAAWLASLLEEGYVRVQVADTVYRIGEQTVPAVSASERIWVLLDRVEIGKTPVERLSESIELGFRRGDGSMGVLDETHQHTFDRRHVCRGCRRAFPTPEPRLFDCHDPLGACPVCHGTGIVGKSADVCSTCQGRRWNGDALAVQVGGRTIAEWWSLPVADLLAFVTRLAGARMGDGNKIFDQIKEQLQSLVSLCLDYLALSQAATDLSDGECKRIALANALGSNLVNVLYLIDEPTTGLHVRHTDELIAALVRLRDRGNTLVVIEHDRSIIAVADHVIDVGPEAGEAGGSVCFQGTPGGLATAAENPTSDWLSGRSFIESPTHKRKPTGFIKLPNVSVEFPLGVLCVVVGNNHLIEQTLYPALTKKKVGADATTKVSGAHQITEVVLLDQNPLTRSSRSNPATYLKIFDEIRSLFAEAIDARIRNFGAGHFSFNQPGGRCETCEGQGTLTIDMQFLADVVSTCPECQGRRYRKEILDIKVRSLSIAEVLDLTIREAFRFFRAQPRIEKKLKWLLDVGLDYLRLGQPIETLSGGECQRLKLAGHLASSRKAGVLFLLTEPSAGLHPADVANLLECFDRLLAAGHSVIASDCDADVLRCADVTI